MKIKRCKIYDRLTKNWSINEWIKDEKNNIYLIWSNKKGERELLKLRKIRIAIRELLLKVLVLKMFRKPIICIFLTLIILWKGYLIILKIEA